VARFSIVIVLLSVTSGGCGKPQRAEGRLELRVATVGPLERVSANELGGLSRLAQDWVYERLATQDDSGNLVPALASLVEARSKGVVHFRLRSGATFSDGSPVTAQDVVQSLEAGELHAWADGEWIAVESRNPGLRVDWLVSFAFIFRRSAAGDLGTGPFVVESEDETRIVLRRRSPAPHRPDRIRLIGYSTPREALARTLKGDADVLPRVEPRLSEFFDRVDRLQLVRGTTSQAASVVFSSRLPREQRRAIAATLNRREIARLAFGDSCHEWTGPTAKAQAPLRGRLDVLSPLLDVGYQRMGSAVLRALGEHGGKLRLVPPTEAARLMGTGDFDLVVSPARIKPMSMAKLAFHSGSIGNQIKYSDPNVDQALDAGDWNRAFAALAENPPATFICLTERLLAIDSRIKDPKIGAWAPLEFLPEWEFKE
jgi:ABC-type oligopeptide transport system substrate-binding subunit